MPKRKTTITYHWKDILALIEKEENAKLKISHLSISEGGDYDMGNYKQEIEYIDFEIIENKK